MRHCQYFVVCLSRKFKYNEDVKGNNLDHSLLKEVESMSKIGEISISSNGLLMVIIAYRSDNDIDVRLENGIIVTNKSYNDFINGNI